MTIRLDSDLGISATGNITSDTYFIGNGALLTGITSSTYGNANVAAYLPTYTGNLNTVNILQASQIAANGNVTANNILSTTETVSGNLRAGNVSSVGNVIAAGVKTDNYMYANGQPFVSSSYDNVNVQALLNSGAFTGDIIPSGNATQSLGSNTNQWLDLWVSNATIYLNSIPLGVSGNGVLQFDGNDIVTSGPNVINTGNVETSGDVVGGNLVIATGGALTFADGSTQTSAYGDANVEAYLPSSNVIIAINSNVANTDSNVANLTLTVANLATTSSLANTDSNVANLTTSLGNTDANVANLTTGLANTNSDLGNLTTTVTNQGNDIANLQGAVYSNANVATFLDNFGSNSIFTTGNISAGDVTLTNLYSPNFYGNAVTYTNATGYVTSSNLFKYDPSTEVLTVGNVSTTGNITTGIITANILVGEGGNISNITGANVTGEVALANTVSNPNQPNITALGTIVSLTANAINVNGQFTANGNAQFNQDVYFAGNVTLPGNIIQVSGNSGQFFGNAITGFGALYAGLPAGYTLLNNEVVQFSDSYDGYTQVSHRNINGGAQATTDYVATADNGTDTTNYVDLGVAGSGYDGALANNSLGTSLYANDGYLYARGNVNGGNLVLGSAQANGVVRIIANGASNIADVVATFNSNGLVLTGGISTAGVASPAPTISGFSFSGVAANISGNVTGGNISTGGTVSATGNVRGANFNTAGAVSATGNVSGDYFLGNGSLLTSLPAPTVTQDITSNGAMSIMLYDGNIKYNNYATVEPSTGNIAGANISATGNVTAANLILGTGGVFKEANAATIIITANIADNNTSLNVSDNGAIIIQADQEVALGIGPNTFISINNTGIEVDSNITARANVAPYALSGWDTISGNTFSASGNVTAGNVTTSGIANVYAMSVNQSITWPGLSTVYEDTNLVLQGNVGVGITSPGTTQITAGSANWYFDNTGNLTLPSNTFSVNYANGTQVSIGGGGSANTGNVTFNDITIQGTGDEYGGSGLYLAPGANSTGNLQYLRVRGGDFPTHIHLDTGNNAYFDQYFGADDKFVKLEANGNVVINANDLAGNSASWTFDIGGKFNTPQGGYIGAAGVKGDGTMLTGGTGNIASLTSFYADAIDIYSSCATANPDGTLNITTYGNGTGVAGQWIFSGDNLQLPVHNGNTPAGESAQFVGTRKIINGATTGATAPYAVELAAGGTPTVAYTSTAGVQSAKITFVTQASGAGFQWEQFDVVATPSGDSVGDVNYVVTNRIKSSSAIPDTVVTATMNGTNQIEISLNLDASQTNGGYASFDATEFGLMID